MVDKRRLTMTAIGRSERRGPARMVKARLLEPQIPVSINRELLGNMWLTPESPEIGSSAEPMQASGALLTQWIPAKWDTFSREENQGIEQGT